MAVDENTIKEAIKELKESSKKRNFTQTFDLIVNLKNLDLKKPDNHVDLYVQLHNSKGRKSNICALVGPELQPEAEKVCDKTVPQHDFKKYAEDKKLIKNLASECHFFIAQANIMPQVATTFGKVFGPKKKMPNPKAGCVVPPNASLKPLYERLQKTIRLYAKERPLIQVPVGDENMDEKQVIENVLTAYDQLIHHLPLEKNNIKSVFIKLTMSKPVMIK
ncbi:50S ribosomal protein L1 [Candidatus Woesearchaeota archaeon]|nr:50S ribosomal protein L1 [Candidatus Woesearchaeota archaeon]